MHRFDSRPTMKLPSREDRVGSCDATTAFVSGVDAGMRSIHEDPNGIFISKLARYPLPWLHASYRGRTMTQATREQASTPTNHWEEDEGECRSVSTCVVDENDTPPALDEASGGLHTTEMMGDLSVVSQFQKSTLTKTRDNLDIGEIFSILQALTAKDKGVLGEEEDVTLSALVHFEGLLSLGSVEGSTTSDGNSESDDLSLISFIIDVSVDSCQSSITFQQPLKEFDEDLSFLCQEEPWETLSDNDDPVQAD